MNVRILKTKPAAIVILNVATEGSGLAGKDLIY
jgi:hypothetical protein